MAKNIDAFIKKLRKKNIRMTTQRLAILEVLAIEGNHPTAYEIYDVVKADFPNMSIATIYNNLNFFKEAGILIEMPFEEGSSRFDLTETRHYHAICSLCGKIVDFDYPELKGINNYVDKEANFKVDDYTLSVTGQCSECVL